MRSRKTKNGLSTKQIGFLNAYAKTGNLTEAGKRARCHRTNHYDWIKDEVYKAAFDLAEEEAVQKLEATVRRRAEEGHEELVMYQGQVVREPRRTETGELLIGRGGKPVLSKRPMTRKIPSDVLAMFLLKAKRPTIYRDNASMEMAGKDGGPLQVEVIFRAPRTPEAGSGES